MNEITESPAIRDEQGRYMPGFSGNPSGRPKDTLKDYLRKKLSEMPPEEKEQFLKDIPKDLQWRMAEGNPATDNKTELYGEFKIVESSKEGIEKYGLNISPIDNTDGQAQI
jgi:hypothetical protein